MLLLLSFWPPLPPLLSLMLPMLLPMLFSGALPSLSLLLVWWRWLLWRLRA